MSEHSCSSLYISFRQTLELTFAQKITLDFILPLLQCSCLGMDHFTAIMDRMDDYSNQYFLNQQHRTQNNCSLL